MTLTTLKTYLAQHLTSIDVSLHAHLTAFVNWVEGEEAKVAAEVAHLVALGYTVVKPGQPVPDPQPTPIAPV